MDAINFVNDQNITQKELPSFRAGDSVAVNYKIIEGAKERIQTFKGDVLQVKGTGTTKTFTVRKMSNGIGVERIFPLFSPSIASVQILKRGKVRRAKLFYLRNLVGKKARIKEKTRGSK
ncbi:MAG: 50S ribosomal protein L19 [Saprospiraceae bacterium]|nr:50S ribosomal protein L19 [Saprospiraceae bacterium]